MTATAADFQCRHSAVARSAWSRSPSPPVDRPGTAAAIALASAALGVTSRAPGTGCSPRGWGSHSSVARRAAAASRGRNASAVPLP
ncbi:hypothetical protein AQ490_17980 [Wenjunlia vitaminophila]|uniref:Uncharacterized protein n=1 Tax=Wenjunlia vitaminophila TaxID=76728 RepID=A0A0T6LW50_WENVI|nr:hypothetical protein AQ490_17980 [Wenjunlia vitaminophila]